MTKKTDINTKKEKRRRATPIFERKNFKPLKKCVKISESKRVSLEKKAKKGETPSPLGNSSLHFGLQTEAG